MNGQQQRLDPQRTPPKRGRFGGWTITCADPACSETTAEQAPGAYWTADEDRAVLAAKRLGWVHSRNAHGELVWVCPLHQHWDETARRWVPDETARSLAS